MMHGPINIREEDVTNQIPAFFSVLPKAPKIVFWKIESNTMSYG